VKPYTRSEAEHDLADALASGHTGEAYRVAELLDRMEPKPLADTVTVALWYASLGLPVFPLLPNSKKPLPASRGLHDATIDPTTIRRVFGAGSNIGLATGHGLDVIDFDGVAAHAVWGQVFPPEDALDPLTGRAAWLAAGIDPFGTVSTPRSGGLHVYVDSDGSGNRSGLFWKGSHIDYRGLGGYVVAPPSRTPDGCYRWCTSLDADRVMQAVS
jgi:hypothetical protein